MTQQNEAARLSKLSEDEASGDAGCLWACVGYGDDSKLVGALGHNYHRLREHPNL